MGDISNKQRFLKIIEILKVETDEENGLTLTEIIDNLVRQFGDLYKVNRKSVKDDLDNLVDAGYVSCENILEHNRNIYKYQKRKLEIYQLRMLIDAVSSARFITNRECKLLINNIKKLTSKNFAKQLQNQIYIDDRIRCNNEKVRYYIDKLHNAILIGARIEFQYGNYNVSKEFVLRHSGEVYKVKPYSPGLE
ncbi:hypothetical protein [Clostridium thailandense]|uniref:hypothetical protein n=1 Tax=Clostridium thailandense TaxID=2794346 RepID=UPI003988E0B8